MAVYCSVTLQDIEVDDICFDEGYLTTIFANKRVKSQHLLTKSNANKAEALILSISKTFRPIDSRLRYVFLKRFLVELFHLD